MSHLTEAQFNAALIRAEEVLKNVLSRIESLAVRPEVKRKILLDYGIEKAEQQLAALGFSERNFGVVAGIQNRINSFFSAVDTYIAYNFDLDVTDYNSAIAQMGEFIIGSTDAITEQALASTEDELLRTYIRSIAKEFSYDSEKDLLEAATSRMQESGIYKRQAMKNVRSILVRNNINDLVDDSSTISISETLNKAHQGISDASVDKAVRNRVLTAIIKIIKEQGFIVKKENVEECGDHANISAIKPNGEKANFVVYLDGKFIYKFHDYEGLSCEKDIGNFEEEFESIYGVKLEEKNIKWSNPDKIGKMAHQTIANRKIGG